MNEMKKDFLRKMVGFSKSDLSLKRQMELDAFQKSYEWEWVMLALTKQSLEDWEKWGFGLFTTEKFKREVDGLVEAFERIRDEDIIKENQKAQKRQREKGNKIWYSEKTLQEQYNKLMNNPVLGPNAYVDYNYITHHGTQKAREILAMIKAENKPLKDLDEKERWVVASSTLVRIMRIKAQ